MKMICAGHVACMGQLRSTELQSGNLKRGDHMRCLLVGEKVILKSILKKYCVSLWTTLNQKLTS